ncbi:MAG: DUF3006 domain-containing protein [Clostridia bacterium]|nr:DUF3006 domain-containing protein [Clostridia bacterium]
MFVIDRIEEGIAVIMDEENKTLKLNADEIDGNVRDGSVVVYENDKWRVDEEETKNRKEKMRKRLNKLFNK